MRKYKNIVSGVLLLAILALTPLRVVHADTAVATADASFTIKVADLNSTTHIASGHTNQSQINLDWDDVNGAATYELYAWSDTKAPSVRLLASDQISSSAEVTVLSASTTNVKLLRDGVYYYAVKALDSNKTLLETSQITSLTFDTIVPKVFVTNPKFDQEIIGNSLIANGTVSNINLDYYYFILRDSSGKTILTSSNIKEAVSNDVIANLDISTFLSGSYDIAFVARDKAGNQTMLTDPDETASFIVLRKGDSNNFSNPPRAIEPAPAGVAETIPAIAPTRSDSVSATKFKLVSNQSVLGATSSSDAPLPSITKVTPGDSNAKIIAIAKTPTKQSHNVLYLALIPILFCILLLTYEKRQTASAKQKTD